MILERLSSVNLKVKPSSINVGNTRIRLLGHVLSKEGIEIDPEKKEMILTWERPREGSVLQSALGLGVFLHDHVRHYADIVAPLEAVKKQIVIQWNVMLDRHWQLFKRAFANAPIRFPDFNKRFVLATDASNTGIGGILFQPTTTAIPSPPLIASLSALRSSTPHSATILSIRRSVLHSCILYANFIRTYSVEQTLRCSLIISH